MSAVESSVSVSISVSSVSFTVTEYRLSRNTLIRKYAEPYSGAQNAGSMLRIRR